METTPLSRNPMRRKLGRPLSFDRDAALRAAMLAFWRHGYETSSVADLTAAMRITPPSLYAAFGDKRRLFLEAVALYAGDRAEAEVAIADAPTACDAARTFLTAAAITYTGENTPPGCLLASAAASGSAASADVREVVAQVRRSTAGWLRARIERDVAASALPPSTDAAALADLVVAIAQGMSVLARDGASRASLLAVADAGLAGWPTKSS